VAASIRRNIPFPAPHPFLPSACKRQQGITDQSSIRPSSTAAAASPQSSAAFSSQRSWENHPPPKPPPRQIPIDGQALTASRGFALRRLSDAGLIPGRSLTPGRHPKPFSIPAVRKAAINREIRSTTGVQDHGQNAVPTCRDRRAAPDRQRLGSDACLREQPDRFRAHTRSRKIPELPPHAARQGPA
jgi:hypothetical protein